MLNAVQDLDCIVPEISANILFDAFKTSLMPFFHQATGKIVLLTSNTVANANAASGSTSEAASKQPALITPAALDQLLLQAKFIHLLKSMARRPSPCGGGTSSSTSSSSITSKKPSGITSEFWYMNEQETMFIDTVFKAAAAEAAATGASSTTITSSSSAYASLTSEAMCRDEALLAYLSIEKIVMHPCGDLKLRLAELEQASHKLFLYIYAFRHVCVFMCVFCVQTPFVRTNKLKTLLLVLTAPKHLHY